MKILHLEDSADDAELVRLFLKRNGVQAEILPATDQEQFLAGLQTNTLHLVIVDNSLPGFSGQDALKLSRQQRPDLPCIVLSGAMDESRREASQKAGAAAYVLKGDYQDLLTAIKNLRG